MISKIFCNTIIYNTIIYLSLVVQTNSGNDKLMDTVTTSVEPEESLESLARRENISVESIETSRRVHSLPLSHPNQLGDTALLGGICDVPLYQSYILPIFNNIRDRLVYHHLEIALIEEVNKHGTRNQSCYGYYTDSNNRSIVYNYMACVPTQDKATCQCLEQGNRKSSMRFYNHSNKCVHSIDVLQKCDSKLWSKYVEPGLKQVRKLLRGTITNQTLAMVSKRLTKLTEDIEKRFNKDPEKLKSICYTDDFSLKCNKRNYCTCHRQSHFHFVRSDRVDRCVPTNGSYCYTARNNKIDECVESICTEIFNTSLHACGGFEAWQTMNFGERLVYFSWPIVASLGFLFRFELVAAAIYT